MPNQETIRNPERIENCHVCDPRHISNLWLNSTQPMGYSDLGKELHTHTRP